MASSTILDKIEARQAESRRLTQMLRYYVWLEEHGLSWNVIAGVRGPFPSSFKTKQAYRTTCRTLGIEFNPKVRQLISYKLRDESEVVLPAPPFPENVIFNRQVDGAYDDAADAAKEGL